MLKVEGNTLQIMQRARDIALKQLPFAMSQALNDTARSVIEAERGEMERAFDRPTPFTLNAFTYKPATKAVPMAIVRQRDVIGGRDYLFREAAGGVRKAKAIERLIASVAPMAFAAVLPADAAKLDKYGNWDRGQINRVLSNIRAQRDAYSNTTAASDKRQPRRGRYFIPARGGLSPGIFHRDASGTLHHVATFTQAMPSYTPIFRFHEVGEAESLRVMPGHFARRFAEAMASAK